MRSVSGTLREIISFSLYLPLMKRSISIGTSVRWWPAPNELPVSTRCCRNSAASSETFVPAGHSAGDEAHDVERRVLADRDDALLHEHGLRRVAGDLQVVVEARAVLAEARGAVEHEPARLVAPRAHRRLAPDAVAALAARGNVGGAHVNAGRCPLRRGPGHGGPARRP